MRMVGLTGHHRPASATMRLRLDPGIIRADADPDIYRPGDDLSNDVGGRCRFHPGRGNQVEIIGLRAMDRDRIPAKLAGPPSSLNPQWVNLPAALDVQWLATGHLSRLHRS